jgi:hypothetical protein
MMAVRQRRGRGENRNGEAVSVLSPPAQQHRRHSEHREESVIFCRHWQERNNPETLQVICFLCLSTQTTAIKNKNYRLQCKINNGKYYLCAQKKHFFNAQQI